MIKKLKLILFIVFFIYQTSALSKTTDAIDFQLDDYHLKRLTELGLDGDDGDSDDPYDLVSYK